MNLPNKLTTLRVILIPVFCVLFIISIPDATTDRFNIYRLISAIIFVFASLTDFFDGKIARKYNLVTNYGKLMDPLADKMLVISAMLLLTHTTEIHYLILLIVVLRELAISSIRLIALEQGLVIAASYWGKYKAATQMVAVTLILLKAYQWGPHSIMYIITYGLLYISTILTIISLIDYAVKNRGVFKQN